MKTLTTITLLLQCLALISLAACGNSQGDSSDQLRLARYIPKPETFPSSCALKWLSKPMFIAPTEQHPDDFLGSVIGGFWFDNSTSVDLSTVTVGFSNVYSADSMEFAIANIGLVFETESNAKIAHQYLLKEYSWNPNFFIMRDKRDLVWFVSDDILITECSKFLSQALESGRAKTT